MSLAGKRRWAKARGVANAGCRVFAFDSRFVRFDEELGRSGARVL